MTFARVNPLGWALYEVLTSAQMNALDINMTRAVDGFAGGTYSPSAPLVWNEQIQADAASSSLTNAVAIQGTGKGSEPGLKGVGSTTGNGTEGVGGASAGNGLSGTGGASGGKGVVGQGGASSGEGVRGLGGAPDGEGVYGEGDGSGAGVRGVGTAGAGVAGVASVSGHGVFGVSTGTGDAVKGSATTRHAIKGSQSGTPFTGTFGCDPCSADPTNPVNGDYWLRSGEGFAAFLDSLKQTMTPTWGVVITGGGGPTLNVSNNITSVSYSGTDVVFTLTHSFAASDEFAMYAGKVNSFGGPFLCQVDFTGSPVTAVVVSLFDVSGSTPSQIDLSANAHTISIMGFGALS